MCVCVCAVYLSACSEQILTMLELLEDKKQKNKKKVIEFSNWIISNLRVSLSLHTLSRRGFSLLHAKRLLLIWLPISGAHIHAHSPCIHIPVWSSDLLIKFKWHTQRTRAVWTVTVFVKHSISKSQFNNTVAYRWQITNTMPLNRDCLLFTMRQTQEPHHRVRYECTSYVRFHLIWCKFIAPLLYAPK